jgi:DNA-binding NarL/FixJ family response regulator
VSSARLLPVTIEGDAGPRMPAAIETAAYFVATEALANAAKHAGADGGRIRLERQAQALVVEVSDDGRGGANPGRLGPARLRRRVEALDGTLAIDSPPGRRDAHPRRAAVRAVIAEDLALLRAGLERLLTAHDIEVVRTVADGPSLIEAVVELRPGRRGGRRADAAELHRRGPARRARGAPPGRGLGVLVLSQYVEPGYAAELLADGHGGVGYLLKERVGDTREFVDAVRRVAAGGGARPRGRRAVRRARAPRPAAGADRARARGARLMAEGRSNVAIADALVVTAGAVEKHVTAIFGKLGLGDADSDNRRVLAVLAYLRAAEEARGVA